MQIILHQVEPLVFDIRGSNLCFRDTIIFLCWLVNINLVHLIHSRNLTCEQLYSISVTEIQIVISKYVLCISITY